MITTDMYVGSTSRFGNTNILVQIKPRADKPTTNITLCFPILPI